EEEGRAVRPGEDVVVDLGRHVEAGDLSRPGGQDDPRAESLHEWLRVAGEGLAHPLYLRVRPGHLVPERAGSLEGGLEVLEGLEPLVGREGLDRLLAPRMAGDRRLVLVVVLEERV